MSEMNTREKNGKQRVSDQVKESIQDMILNQMKAAERLPTEAVLTEMFGASRSSVREALQALEASGIVEKRNGGTYVADSMDECFVCPLTIMVQLNMTNISEVIQVRKLLEIEAAGLAAKNATEEQIREIDNILWLMQKPDIMTEEYIEQDIRFHLALALAAHNTVLYQFINDVNVVVSKFYPRICTAEVIQEHAIPTQKKIVQALKERDCEGCKKYMEEHLNETKGSF